MRSRSSARRPSVPCRRRPSRPSAKWTMLQHWHAQRRSSLSAQQRRFLGVSSALLECKMEGCAPRSHGDQVRPLSCASRFKTRALQMMLATRVLITTSMAFKQSLGPSTLTTVYASTTSRSKSCALVDSLNPSLPTDQRPERSSRSSSWRKARLLFRIASVRCFQSMPAGRERPCATSSRLWFIDSGIRRICGHVCQPRRRRPDWPLRIGGTRPSRCPRHRCPRHGPSSASGRAHEQLAAGTGHPRSRSRAIL